MDHSEGNEDDGEPHCPNENIYYVEDTSSSDGERETLVSRLNPVRRCKRDTRASRESSPPLLLVFSRSSQRDLSMDTGADQQEEEEEEEEEEDSDQSIEEWMILDETVREEDASIQLNLSYYHCSEEESGDEDISEKKKKTSTQDIWAVSEKDKYGSDRSASGRYFASDRSRVCPLCNRTGHPPKSCYLYKKCPTCVLCGLQGHLQKVCPSRPCVTCGRPSHGLRSCEIPPIWNQHCQRCGMTGHLSAACPDIWRQYHLTTAVEAPLRPHCVQHFRCSRRYAYCYNCSKRGHRGHECALRRMVSGTFPSLPYVCRYDTTEEIRQRLTCMQEKAKDPGQSLEKTGSCGEEDLPVQARSRTKQEANSRAARRKTWPERRKERQKVKRLRREAQAIREGGLPARLLHHSEEVCAMNPFGKPTDDDRHATSSLKKNRRDKVGGRKNKDAGKWKKMGWMKNVDLLQNGDFGCDNLRSPKQRVRHRRI